MFNPGEKNNISRMSTERFASAQDTLSVRRETLLKCVQFCERTKEIRLERFTIVHYIHLLSRYNNAFSTRAVLTVV